MAYSVILYSSAVKDLATLPREMRARIAQALRDLERFPYDRGIKKLKPPFDGYRKRVGDYRILFDVKKDAIFVHRIKHRADAYRG